MSRSNDLFQYIHSMLHDPQPHWTATHSVTLWRKHECYFPPHLFTLRNNFSKLTIEVNLCCVTRCTDIYQWITLWLETVFKMKNEWMWMFSIGLKSDDCAVHLSTENLLPLSGKQLRWYELRDIMLEAAMRK